VNALRAVGGIVVAVSLGGCGLDLIYADWKVDQLCKKDGGVTTLIHERAPADLLKANGEINIDALVRPKQGQEYFAESTLVDIQTDDPKVFRSEYRLYRREGNVLLGTSVAYYRVGQNISIPILSRRPYSCPAGNELINLANAVFVARERTQ